MNQKRPSNKPLIATLCGLFAVIIILVVAIVVVKINTPHDPDTTVSTSDENESQDDTQADQPSNQDDPEEKELRDKLTSTNIEALDFFNETPPNFDEVNAIYNSGIEFALSKGRKDYVMQFILSRNNMLVNNGYERQALDALLTVDPNTLNESDRPMLNSLINNLANFLGDTATAQQYQSQSSSTGNGNRSDTVAPSGTPDAE